MSLSITCNRIHVVVIDHVCTQTHGHVFMGLVYPALGSFRASAGQLTSERRVFGFVLFFAWYMTQNRDMKILECYRSSIYELPRKDADA